MSYLDELFKTTNQDLINTVNQNTNDFEIVKGSDMYKGFYEKSIVKTNYIKYYQVATFTDNYKKKTIRSYYLEGKSSKGACFFDYRVIKIKDYRISEENFNKFINFLDNQIKNNKNSNIKIMYKYYPVYNFTLTAPPTGNEINECVSELLM